MMDKKKLILILILGAIAIYMTAKAYLSVLKNFLPSWEGFSAEPYWDFKQWSWGFGTKVPGSTSDRNINPGGTITPEQAFAAATSHIQADFSILKPLISRNLTANQWAALLSFSYNLGAGNAKNLVTNINSGDDDALASQWMEYVNAGGQYNQQLADRRQAEIDLWNS